MGCLQELCYTRCRQPERPAKALNWRNHHGYAHDAPLGGLPRQRHRRHSSSQEKEKQEELKTTKENINSEEYIEEVAREKLDMYLPNEKVYIDISK